MLFKEVIKLISITISENDMGDPVEIPVEREVFADKQSIRQSEFYQAAATGLRPELMFVVRTIDYNNEPKARWPATADGKEYNIIRTYDKDGELTELICQGVVNNANA
jgi:SPP1 family predicted phage head-tail adaptor